MVGMVVTIQTFTLISEEVATTMIHSMAAEASIKTFISVVDVTIMCLMKVVVIGVMMAGD